MTYASPRSLRTATAICAVLVLGSIPAWAQDAAPPLDGPVVSSPVAPQPTTPRPTIVLPTEAPAPPATVAAPVVVAQPMVQPVAQQPVVVAEPEAAAPVRPAASKRSAAPRTTARAAAAAPAAALASAPAPQAVAAPAASAVEPLPPVAPVPVAEPAMAPPPSADAPRHAPIRSETGLPGALIAGLIAALGLGGAAAWFAARSRRRREDTARWQWDDGARVEPEAAAAAPEPFFVAADPALAEAAQAQRQPEVIAAQAIEPTPHPTAAQRIGGEKPAPPAFVPLAGRVPQTREERDALLDAMVSAPPDANNPFTSRKARLRRARIILQSLEHDQDQAASEPFDWRTYKPAAGDAPSATPARVTA